MRVERYYGCPPEAMQVRQRVFVEEQGFRDEFDQIDGYATHFVLFDSENAPVATCRVFESPEKNIYILGRLAVIKHYRGQGWGSALVKQAEAHVCSMGGLELRLHAQCRVKDFYAGLGFSAFGDVEYEEDCPHIWMKKSWKP